MNRFGWTMLLLFVLAGGSFAALVRRGDIRLTQAASPPAPASPVSSDLVVPVAGIPVTSLVDSFDEARGGGARRHGAIDIMAPRGTPVLAAAAGTIEKLFESEAGGHTLYIRSPDQRSIYYYAHLDAYDADAREGGAVTRGQQIATVGSTGDADPAGPHLHFEIKRMAPGEKWWQGTPVDPYPLLGGR